MILQSCPRLGGSVSAQVACQTTACAPTARPAMWKGEAAVVVGSNGLERPAVPRRRAGKHARGMRTQKQSRKCQRKPELNAGLHRILPWAEAEALIKLVAK